jgi:hypothetical protein
MNRFERFPKEENENPAERKWGDAEIKSNNREDFDNGEKLDELRKEDNQKIEKTSEEIEKAMQEQDAKKRLL